MLSFSPSGMLRRAIRSAAQHLRQDRARRGRPPQTRPALAEALEPRQLLTVAIYSNGEPTVNEGTTYYPVISASGDDDEIVYDLTVDWGQGAIQYDGSTAYPAIPCPDGPEDHTINVTCNFGPGTNTHSLTSSPVSASFDYHVENVPPTLTVHSGGDIYQGYEYSFTVDYADPGEDDITNFTIDWGDGTVESNDGGYGRNSSAEFSHLYWKAGNHSIAITATDEDGSYSTGDHVDVLPLEVRCFSANVPYSPSTMSATSPGDADLWLDFKQGGQTGYLAMTVWPQPPDYQQHVLWIVNDGAEGGRGTLNDNSTPLSVEAASNYAITAGADFDDNGQLDEGETQQTINVRVVDLELTLATHLATLVSGPAGEGDASNGPCHNTWTVTDNNGQNAPIIEYRYEMVRTSGSDWSTMDLSTESSYGQTVKVAGFFHARVAVTIKESVFWTDVEDVEQQFPALWNSDWEDYWTEGWLGSSDFSSINGQSTFSLMCQSAWNWVLQQATSEGRRECGFWIVLDTALMQYGYAWRYGNTIDDGERPTMSVGDWPSEADNPAPDSSPTYRVGFFHAHTPQTFCSAARAVGPSWDMDDPLHNQSLKLPGLVADYASTMLVQYADGAFRPGIPAGYPKDGAWRLYSCGPVRRATPQ